MKMKTKKYKIHKTFSIDSIVCEKWEGVISSQDKNFSETIEEHMIQDIESLGSGSGVAVKTESAPKVLDEEFKQFVEDRVTPIFSKETEITEEEGRQVRSLLKTMEMAANKIKLSLKLSGSLMFQEIPKYDRLEKERLRQLEAAKEYREKNIRLELMKELPYPLEQDEETDSNKNSVDDIEEADLISQTILEQERQRKIKALKEEVERKKREGWEITKE